MPLNIKEQGPIQREAGETLHAPISHHCYCDGKTDVDVGQADADTLVAKCRACNITFKFEGGLRSALHQMLPNVSLRAEAMFLTFSGRGISFFFGAKEALLIATGRRLRKSSARSFQSWQLGDRETFTAASAS